jgi:hypothetical protein
VRQALFAAQAGCEASAFAWTVVAV